MKKYFTLAIVAVMVICANQLVAQGNAEKAATDIINAYKNKDVTLFKKYITGVMVYAVNDNFFESSDGKPLSKIAEKWDEDIKEIRYTKGDLMGKTVLLANVYFSDNPNGNLNVVMLTSMDNSDWKAFAYGITDVSKEEFEKGSKEIPEEKEEQKTEIAKAGHSAFSIEMANGDTFDNPSIDKLKELLKSLDDENFFIILNSESGFLQSTTSEEGYIVQYSENDNMFEAEAYFTLDMLVDIFQAYLDGKDWKGKATWVDM